MAAARSWTKKKQKGFGFPKRKTLAVFIWVNRRMKIKNILYKFSEIYGSLSVVIQICKSLSQKFEVLTLIGTHSETMGFISFMNLTL